MLVLIVFIAVVGNTTVKVPNLLGHTVDTAFGKIRDLGLETNLISNTHGALDTITYQDPIAESYVSAGSIVTLKTAPDDFSDVSPDHITNTSPRMEETNTQTTGTDFNKDNSNLYVNDEKYMWSCQVEEYDYLRGNINGDYFTRTYIGSEYRYDKDGNLKLFYKYNECTLVRVR